MEKENNLYLSNCPDNENFNLKQKNVMSLTVSQKVIIQKMNQ